MIALINERFNSLLADFADVLAIVCAILFIVLIVAIVLSVKRAGKLKKKNAELSKRLAATENELIEAGRASVQSPAPASKDKEESGAPEAKAEEPATPAEPKPAPTADKEPVKTEEPDDGVEEVPIGEIGAGGEEEKSEEAKPRRVSVAAPRYIVKYDSKTREWIVLKAGNTRATRRVKTKQEALAIAKELSKNSDASLVVHKKDGKFQKQ